MMTESVTGRVAIPLTISVVVFSLFIQNLHAQGIKRTKNITVVNTYLLLDEAAVSGDIVAYDENSDSHLLSRITNDEQVFGVVQERPVIVFRSDEGGVPVAELGEVLVNVTTLNGPIARGDYITTSPIAGKGQLFTDEDGFIVGRALEPFDETTSTTTVRVGGQDLAVGSILVLLDVGSFQEGYIQVPAPAIIVNEEPTEGNLSGGDIFRYVMATFFAIASLFLIFKNFGPNLREGVISVGRNPLAKSTIQSMVTFNIFLILIISIASLLVSLAIILLPL